MTLCVFISLFKLMILRFDVYCGLVEKIGHSSTWMMAHHCARLRVVSSEASVAAAAAFESVVSSVFLFGCRCCCYSYCFPSMINVSY